MQQRLRQILGRSEIKQHERPRSKFLKQLHYDSCVFLSVASHFSSVSEPVKSQATRLSLSAHQALKWMRVTAPDDVLYLMVGSIWDGWHAQHTSSADKLNPVRFTLTARPHHLFAAYATHPNPSASAHSGQTSVVWLFPASAVSHSTPNLG